MNLPIDFTIRMQKMLKNDYQDFFASYNNTHNSALRLNPLKNTDFLIKYLSEKVAWAENGYYFNSETSKMGKLPYHNMGLYYIQEPSAMLPAEVLDAQEDEVILDLCAAPGGKSTQIALKMKNQGLLISNEIIPKRANILKDNISRLGITNTIVLNETPENISKRFDNYFDKILVDSPCSGEGMFRKSPEAINEWSLHNVQMCANRQLDILNTVKNCLKDNGVLVYSTCTFSAEENEQVIEQFLIENPEFKLLPIENKYFSKGMIENTKNNFKYIENTIRIFPHITNGEGHFVAKLIKLSHTDDYPIKLQKSTINKKSSILWEEFENKFLTNKLQGTLLQFGENIYLAPNNCPSLEKVKVVYPGLLLGNVENNRFTPSHELALSLQISAKSIIELTETELNKYMHGETITTNKDIKDWVLLTYQNNPVCWGKITNGIIKNHYPKYLRT